MRWAGMSHIIKLSFRLRKVIVIESSSQRCESNARNMFNVRVHEEIETHMQNGRKVLVIELRKIKSLTALGKLF